MIHTHRNLFEDKCLKLTMLYSCDGNCKKICEPVKELAMLRDVLFPK